MAGTDENRHKTRHNRRRGGVTMARYKCELKGNDKLIKALEKKSKALEVQKIVSRHTIAMAKKMKEECPVDTGFLRNSIIFEVSALRGEVGPTADYAGYVNYGTRYMPANEFIGRAFNYQKALFLAEIGRLVK